MKAVSRTSEIQLGDFISLTARKCSGCVVDIADSEFGSDSSIKVLIQEDPNTNKSRWYRLEDGQFKFV